MFFSLKNLLNTGKKFFICHGAVNKAFADAVHQNEFDGALFHLFVFFGSGMHLLGIQTFFMSRMMIKFSAGSDLLILVFGKKATLHRDESCGNKTDCNTLSVKKLKIHQFFDSMSDSMPKV